MDILEKYKDRILSKLNEACTMYKTIGFSEEESPRWMNIAEYDKENHRLYFRSTQRRRLYFYVEIEEKDSEEMYKFIHRDNSGRWDWFKKQRTNFLIEHHPDMDSGYEKFELK